MEKTVYIDSRGWRYKVMAGLGHDTFKHMQRHMDGRKYSGSVTWAYDANTQKT